MADDKLEAMRKAMLASLEPLKASKARHKEQLDEGIELDADVMGIACDSILDMAGHVAMLETMRLATEHSAIAKVLSPGRVHFSVLVSVLAGALSVAFVRDENCTPERFSNQMPKLAELIKDMYMLNYAKRVQQMDTGKDQDDNG